MPHVVKLQINGVLHAVNLDSPNAHTIREDDEISLAITVDHPELTPEIYFEDAEPELTLSAEAAGLVWRIPTVRYFAECFGQSYVRIYVEGQTYQVFFDVRARKISALAAEKMIRYLARQHESLIRACFARSTTAVGSSGEGSADPESIIATAEEYVRALLNYQSEFMVTKRTRLVPTRRPMWKTFRNNFDIDPIDILGNLDAITPVANEGHLYLRGRHFSIGDISVSTLIETPNLHENKILLGGLYSIRARLRGLMDGLDTRASAPSPADGYESFDRLLLVLTSGGMMKRCQAVTDRVVELIRLFEDRLGITYDGELRPVMTPYARTSKVYRALYTILDTWYALGIPSLGATNFLLKLKSLSKIYELYALFHLVNHMLESNWGYVSLKSHPEHGDFIPQEVVMTKDGVKATVTYEPTILPLTAYKAQHNDLVDVAHRRPNGAFSYWKPDYVIRLEVPSGQTKYLILDAKYSTEGTVDKIHLPEVIQKYFFGLAGHDANRGAYTNDLIGAVVVLYPIGVTRRFIRYGRRTAIGAKDVPLPIFGAAGLSIEQDQIFGDVMNELLERVSVAIH